MGDGPLNLSAAHCKNIDVAKPSKSEVTKTMPRKPDPKKVFSCMLTFTLSCGKLYRALASARKTLEGVLLPTSTSHRL